MDRKWTATALCVMMLFGFCGCVQSDGPIIEPEPPEEVVENVKMKSEYRVYTPDQIKADSNNSRVKLSYYPANGSYMAGIITKGTIGLPLSVREAAIPSLQ